MLRLHLSLALALLLASCAGDAEQFDRAGVSAELEERIGMGIGEGAPPGTVSVPEGVSLQDGISEREAVAIALWNNAAFQEALAELGIKRAELIQAGLLTNPLFSFLFPVGKKQYEFALTLPLEALWLLPQRVAAAELDCERMAALLVESGLETVFTVKRAYADLQCARQRAAVLSEVVSQREQILAVYEARLRAGDVSALDVSQARVKVLEARSEAARCTRELAGRRDRLTILLGFADDPRELKYEKVPGVLPAVEAVPAELVKRALAFRPDLRAAELSLEAAGERAGLARWDVLALSAILDANEEGEDGFEIGPGLAVEIPIFDWNQGGRARAEAELQRAARHYVTVRDQIVLEVREAHTHYRQVLEELTAWRREILPSIEKSHGLAEKAYRAGDTSPLPVLQWKDRHLAGRLHEAKLTADVHIARARLERTVGGRLDRASAAAFTEEE